MEKSLRSVVVALICCISFYAQAQSGSCGTALTWRYADGVLNIEGEGEMSIGSTASYAIYKDVIKSIVVGEGVTSIANDAFKDFSLVESVTLPSTLLSIGQQAFNKCVALKAIALPESLQKIGSQSFAYCDLHSLTVPKNVIEVGNSAFDNNRFLEVVNWNCNIPRDTYEEPSGSYAYRWFFGNSGIIKVVFGENVTEIPDHLFYRTSLNEVVTSGKIEYVGMNAFDSTPWMRARATKPIYVDHNLYFWPLDANAPVKIEIPEGTKGITPLVFADNVYITEITLPKSLEYMGGGVFADCHSLTKINYNSENLKAVPYAYHNGDWVKVLGPALAELIVGADVKSLPAQLCKTQPGLKEVVLPNVEYIGEECFRECKGLTKVQFGKVKEISQSAFYNTPIEKISLPETVEYIDKNAFSMCPPQNLIVLGPNLKNIGNNIFGGATIDTLIFKTSLPDVENGRGRLAAQVNHIIISDDLTVMPPHILWDGTIGGGNYVCKTITVGRSIREKPSFSRSYPADTVYWNAENAMPINTGNSNNYYVSSCRKLIVGDNVKILPTGMMTGHYLEEATFGNSLESIGAYIFEFAKIKSLSLPSSLKTIGKGAFRYCRDLETVTANWEDPRLVDVPSDVFSDKNPEAVLFVPKGTENLYASIDPWKQFINIGSNPNSWEKPQCEAPYVTFSEGSLKFVSETDDATFHYTITDSDIKSDEISQGVVKLSATYEIDVYSSAPGHINSEMTHTILCFLKPGSSAGVDNIFADTRGVAISVTGHDITVSGLDENEEVKLYDLSGKLIAQDKAIDGKVYFKDLSVNNGIVIVKFNGEAIKVAI